MCQVEHVLEELVPIGDNLVECATLSDGVPQTMASRLNLICTALAYLLRNAKSVLGDSTLQDRIPSLLVDAFDVNKQLSDWSQSVPTEWQWLTATSFEIPSNVPREKYLYNGRADVYYDLFVAGIWNFYRAIRIKVLMIALKCLSAISFQCHENLADQRQSAIEDLQSLVDDICGSIPFHLGTKMAPGYDDDLSVEFPYIGTKANKEHRRAAAGSGGWALIEPYSEPLAVAIEVSCTRAGQREWLLAQLSRIAGLYNVAPKVDLLRQKNRQQ